MTFGLLSDPSPGPFSGGAAAASVYPRLPQATASPPLCGSHVSCSFRSFGAIVSRRGEKAEWRQQADPRPERPVSPPSCQPRRQPRTGYPVNWVRRKSHARSLQSPRWAGLGTQLDLEHASCSSYQPKPCPPTWNPARRDHCAWTQRPRNRNRITMSHCRGSSMPCQNSTVVCASTLSD